MVRPAESTSKLEIFATCLLVTSTIRSLSIPVCWTISINDMAWSSSDRNVGPFNINRVKVIIGGSSEGLPCQHQSSFRHEPGLTVLPANVTVDPVLSLVKRIVELAGADIFSKTMFVHAAMTDVICAYSEAVQDAGALLTEATEVAFTTEVEDDFITAAAEEAGVETTAAFVEVVVAIVVDVVVACMTAGLVEGF